MHTDRQNTLNYVERTSETESDRSPVAVRILKVTFSAEKFIPGDIPRFRAYLSRQYPQFGEIHNHLSQNRFRYIYPELQFSFLYGLPTIIAHGKGLEILFQIFIDVEGMEINHQMRKISAKSIEIIEGKIGLSEKMQAYRFITPWMALNQNNYNEYQQLTPDARQSKLNRILWGNLKTVAHAFNYWISDPDKIQVQSQLQTKTIKFKGKTMLAFIGEFQMNFHFPDFLGLGKQVARGFGTVKQLGGSL